MSSGSFQVSVVTPEGAVLETEAISVVFPAYDGEYGVLPDHAPLVTLLGIGELRVTRAERGGTDRYYVDGGFAQFADGKLSLLTEQAIDLDELDPEEPQRLLEEARAMKTPDHDSAAARRAMFERARVQKRLVGRTG